MITLAQENPFFVLPLPRDAAESPDGKVKTDEYEMFYLQWLFHPTPHTAPPTPGESQIPLPPTTSIIFTPLEEYKRAGEWASPYLVLTHYPDLAQSHNVVLMRGEITAQSATGPPGSLVNPGWLLSQQQAQLLALALQRFYCADVAPRNETAGASLERAKRRQTLGDFRTKPEQWDWTKLVDMSYGGMI
jgi:ATP synthase F1 complex assembly factor 1